MRILFITPRSDIGGGPKHLLELAQATKKQYPKSMVVIAAPDQYPYAPLLKKVSDQFIKIPARSFSFISFLRLLFLCKTYNIEIVHSHGLGAGVYSRLLALFSIRVFHTFHGIHSKTDFLSRVKSCTEKILSLISCHFIFVSQSEKKLAIQHRLLICSKYSIIENGISLEGLSHDLNINQEKQKIKLCLLSRFDPHKNLARSIELFASLAINSNTFILNIGGFGPEEDNLKSLVKKLGIEEKVTFHGKIDNIEAFLKEQDIYLSSSLSEGLPYTVLEAMKLGVVPLLSNVSGHKDILPNEYLFELNDDADFQRKFLSLTKRANHCFPTILKSRFDLDAQIRKVIELYKL